MRYEFETRRFPNEYASEVDTETIEVVFYSDDLGVKLGKRYDGESEKWSVERTTNISPQEHLSWIHQNCEVAADSTVTTIKDIQTQEPQETNFMLICSKTPEILGQYDIIETEIGLGSEDSYSNKSEEGFSTYSQDDHNDQFSADIRLQRLEPDIPHFTELLNYEPIETQEARKLVERGLKDLDSMDYRHFDF